MEIPASAVEKVLLEPDLERDKTGDVGKFHDTYIIHISKLMITRDHTLLISNPFSLQRPFGYLLFDIFLFNLYICYGKQGLTLRAEALRSSFLDRRASARRVTGTRHF